jgi:HEPN domain-containing protein
MDIEQRLSQVADRYRAQGYRVVVHPGPDALPPFAKDFHVELLAERPDGNVLVSAKGSRPEFEADTNLSKYAELIEKQAGGWYDVFVLEPAPQPPPEKRDAKEPSEQEISGSLDDAERMLRSGFVRQALIAAWAALEAAMRRRLMAEGKQAGWGSSPRTMLNELYSDGLLPGSVFRDLEGLFQARSAIVHGFTTPEIEPSAVQFLVDTARRLLDESRAAKKIA